MRYWTLLLALLLVSLGVMPSARANGRFPESLRLYEYRNNPDRLVLTGTFGILVTEDRGKNWYYVCEKAFAFDFIEGDPVLEIMPDGTMLGGIIQSLNMSRDCACTWQYSLGEPMQETVWDLTIDRSSPQRVLGLLHDSTAIPIRSSVHESLDSGRTWRKVSDLPANVFDSYTIDIAPSDSSRIYVTGVARPEAGLDGGVILVSRDRGMTWEEIRIPNTSSWAQPYIAAVLPTNPDAIFVRTDEWLDNVDPSANDKLLYSADAGKTWKEVFGKGGKLFGFALSPDLSTVVIGLGDPLVAGGRSTEPDDLGVYKASLKDLTFEKIYSGMISCLSWTSTGLYVCHVEYGPAKLPTEDFELGFAKDANFTLATPNPLSVLLNLKNVRGPLPCLSNTCKESWSMAMDGTPATCDRFNADCNPPASDAGLTCSVDDAGTMSDARDEGSGGGGAAGRDGAAGAGTAGGAGTRGGAGGSGAGGSTTSGASGGVATNTGDSCSCRVGVRSERSAAYLAVLLAAALVRRRRRSTIGAHL